MEDDEAIYGEEVTTLLFVDSRMATGTTACRDYSIGYTASAGRVRIPYKGMSGSVEPCTQEAIDQEHLFVEDLGWANEYATHRSEGTERLMVGTSRGKTLTFEPLSQTPGIIFDKRWRLMRFLNPRTDSSGMRLPRKSDAGPDENITTTFDEWSIEGSLGRGSCAYRAVGRDGTPLVGPDETISIAAALVAEDSCDDGVSISPKQQRYLDVLTTAERYAVFGERLVIITSGDGALVFQPG